MDIVIKKDKDFYRHFPDSEACRNYLVQMRWNGMPTCTKCGNNQNNYYLKTRKVYKCSSCRKQFTVLQGTIFQSTKAALEDWFYAIFLFVEGKGKDGLASTKLSRRIGVQQRTAWLMLQKIRETMKDENMKKVLSGIVECDEAYIGSKPGKDLRLRKRMDNYTALHEKEYEHLKAVFGVIDRYSGQIVIRKFGWSRNCLNNEIANHLLKKHVNTISTVNTDAHPGYSQLENHFHSHQVIRKKREETRTIKGVKRKVTITSYVDGKKHVNGIENVWNHLQKMEKCVYIQFSYKHTHRYLDEFTFRWNRRTTSVGKKMMEVVANAFGKTITYKQLKHWNHNFQSKPWAA
jgi:transposase-like protein